MDRPSGIFRSQPRSVSLTSFPRNGSSLDRTLTSTPSVSPACRVMTRSGGLSHDGENALVVRRERVLLHVRRAVRNQHHRATTHLPRRWRGRGTFVGKLVTHPFKDPFGHSESVPLSPHLRQLLGQPFFEFVQRRTLRGDPCQQSGIHTPDRRRHPGPREQEPASRLLTDDLLLRQPPTTSVSTPRTGHTSPLTCGFKLAKALCCSSIRCAGACAPEWREAAGSGQLRTYASRVMVTRVAGHAPFRTVTIPARKAPTGHGCGRACGWGGVQ